ncbi:AAEL006900-PA [Aedes aegypti]|uniref:AAEL006900-PA n=2 Tax=Aedes aegypti TaxID=7159 RepID=A0A1S4FF50_AEDAE|nr:uncharacterized protein LOC5568492 [Aedes aegypti]EAT41464.1 AAEL006900-PA [Aedes aegypti]
MSATPDRLNVSKTRLQSPRTPASPSAGTVGASRVIDSVTKFIDLHKKWQLTTQKGTQYCNAIENIKKAVLDPKQQQQEDCNPYPANLELYCKNLAILVTILEDVIANLNTMIEQLKVLHLVMKDEVVGRTWSLGKVLDALQSISGHWQSELNVRKLITENIGHSVDIAQLALHVATWEQLSNQHENANLSVKMLSVEFSIPLE